MNEAISAIMAVMVGLFVLSIIIGAADRPLRSEFRHDSWCKNCHHRRMCNDDYLCRECANTQTQGDDA